MEQVEQGTARDTGGTKSNAWPFSALFPLSGGTGTEACGRQFWVPCKLVEPPFMRGIRNRVNGW